MLEINLELKLENDCDVSREALTWRRTNRILNNVYWEPLASLTASLANSISAKYPATKEGSRSTPRIIHWFEIPFKYIA